MSDNANSSARERVPLLVVGVHTASEGYPNTKYRLGELRKIFNVVEVNVPLIVEQEGGLRYTKSPIWGGVRFVYVHMATMLAAVLCRRSERAYIPYPAPVILWIYSLLPKNLRPRRIVADAFISVYDTVVNDRGLLSPNGVLARLLWRVERRAYKTADCVIVDTALNARFYAELFSLPRSKFLSVPLSTNEDIYREVRYEPNPPICRVLFIGTLVPLQGVETIVAAAALLGGYREIHFTIIGDGQDSPKIEAAMQSTVGNITWKRNWAEPAELAHEIANADICLGIFGGGDKSQRVCPYKLYAYGCVGRAIITGRTDWVRAAEIRFGSAPFAVVPVTNPGALAEEVLRLSSSIDCRIDLSKESRRFYEAELSNESSISIIRDHLMSNNGVLDQQEDASDKRTSN